MEQSGVRLISLGWYSSSDEAVVWVSWSCISCYKRSVPTEAEVKRKCSQWHQLIHTCSLPWRALVILILKFPVRLQKKRKLHRLFHHLHVSTQTYIRVSWVSLPSLIYSMTSSMIDWPSVVTEKKTVSSDCLFRGNQAVINFALLTLSELLRQVNRPSQALMKAGFWSGVNGADHCIHSGLFTPSEIKPAWQTVTWKQPLNFMFLYAWWLPSNQAFIKALFLWFWL